MCQSCSGMSELIYAHASTSVMSGFCSGKSYLCPKLYLIKSFINSHAEHPVPVLQDKIFFGVLVARENRRIDPNSFRFARSTLNRRRFPQRFAFLLQAEG